MSLVKNLYFVVCPMCLGLFLSFPVYFARDSSGEDIVVQTERLHRQLGINSRSHPQVSIYFIICFFGTSHFHSPFGIAYMSLVDVTMEIVHVNVQ